jgi:rubrerythrin
MTSRRDLIRITGLSAAATLAACGGEDKRPPTLETPLEKDIRLLNSALDFEHIAIAAYSAGVDLLRGPARELGELVLAHEQAHAAVLRTSITELGGTPNRVRSREEYRRQFPNLERPRDVLRFGIDLENAAVKRYVDLIPRFTRAGLRQTVGAIAASEGEHIALLRGALDPGGPATLQIPDAFVTGVASVS